MHGSVLSEVRDGLNSYKGIWRRIADETGVGHSTIAKIAQGKRANPQLQTIVALHGWLQSHGGLVEQPAGYDGPDRRKQAA